MATNYLDMLDAVKAYYGSGSDQWMSIAQYGVTEQNWQYLSQVPGVEITISESGKYLGYDYVNPFPATTNPASLVNSNAQTGVYGTGSFNAPVPSTTIVDQQTGNITSMQSGALATGTGTSVATVAKNIGVGLLAVAAGTQLGAVIDSAIYSIDPDWWDEHYPTINPQTWDTMATTKFGKTAIRSLFGISNPDNTTMYVDEKLLAYTYAMLLDAGVWNSGEGGSTATIDDTTGLSQDVISILPINCGTSIIYDGLYKSGIGPTSAPSSELVTTLNSTSPVYYFVVSFSNQLTTYACSLAPFSGTSTTHNNYGVYNTNFTASKYTLNNKDYYMVAVDGAVPIAYRTYLNAVPNSLNDGLVINQLAYVILYGTITEPISVEGISPTNPEASTHIVPSNVININTGQPVTPNDNIDDILNALKLAYPDLFVNQIYEDVMQPDGTIDRITYNPVPYPDMENPNQPVTDTTEGVDPQQNPEINPETKPESQLQGLTNQLTQTTTPPETGSGSTPVIVPVVGSGSSLWKVYNPSQAQVDAFGAWLWTDNFIEQIKKLFNNPMEAIIGIHKVFAPPSIGGSATIKCGYLDSGVSSNWVSDQYSHVNCGTVNLNEYFGNVFDYMPYTRVHLYLPFIGIVELDTGDVMRSSITVTYHVDVITGACLAEVYVNRDGGGGVIYQYSGSAIVTYPLTSGNYAGAIAGVLSIAGGVIGSIASGGALAPMAVGAISGMSHLHADVQKSGGFSGCAGAMGIKIPYLIISRPQTALADNFPHYTGLPANSTVTLNLCYGHTRVKSVYTEAIPQATHEEKLMIEDLLKTGVLI